MLTPPGGPDRALSQAAAHPARSSAMLDERRTVDGRPRADRRDPRSTPNHEPLGLVLRTTPITKSPQSGQVALGETQQLRMLERLRRSGQQPLTLDELRAGGVDFPAVVLSELEINGYVIERLHEHGRLIGVRLLETAPSEAPASRWRQRRRRASR